MSEKFQLCSTLYDGKQDFPPLANGVYFLGIIKSTPLRNGYSSMFVCLFDLAFPCTDTYRVSYANRDAHRLVTVV